MAKTWKNNKGLDVPVKYIPKLDKEREAIVMKYINKAKKLHDALEDLKLDMVADCDAFFNEMMVKNGVRSEGKGNYSLTSFDKNLKIEIDVQDRIEFDDQIQVAHAKIKEYLEEITQGTTPELVEIVNHAFTTNKGRMDTKRILGLFEIQIKHPKWVDAMELIKGSITRNNSKRYVRLWEKDKNGQYRNIDLNFSSI